MSLDNFYRDLDFPDPTLLDKKIYKRMILEHGMLTSADKRALSEDVLGIRWKFTLKPTTTNVLPYEDAEREYLELAVVEVSLSARDRAPRVSATIQRAIPYPLLLILDHGGEFSVSVAHKRFSLAERERVVAEEVIIGPWIGDERNRIETAFCNALSMSQLPQSDYYALYSAIVRAVVAHLCADFTGKFELRAELDAQDRHEALCSFATMSRQVRSLRAAVPNEQVFAARVGLNAQIKDLEHQLCMLRKKL